MNLVISLKKELGLMYGDNVDPSAIFSLKECSLSEWSQRDVSQGTHPRFLIDINILAQTRVWISVWNNMSLPNPSMIFSSNGLNTFSHKPNVGDRK